MRDNMERARADQWMNPRRFDIGTCVYRPANDAGRDVGRGTLVTHKDDKSAGGITLGGRTRERLRWYPRRIWEEDDRRK